tara:strand:- start:6868 stop:7047 length:180 start_codon:yes stop_codon:yes gene_type:complete
MSDKLKMKALMSLPASGDRKAIKRGASFDAMNEQEARDLVRMGQAERVKSAPAAAAAPK